MVFYGRVKSSFVRSTDGLHHGLILDQHKGWHSRHVILDELSVRNASA
jgi:hypothetical protein